MTSAIEIRDLTKSCDNVHALDDIDLDIPEGSFFGLLGPNGVGKTTFINILIGLVRKTGGEASVFGYDVKDGYREARDRIGPTPQEFNMDRFFSIHEVLERKAGYHGTPRDEIAKHADEALRRVSIYDRRDTRFDWLPGGMKRRFMLTRTLTTDPDPLIPDGPTAGVDAQLYRELWETIADLSDNGATILLTVHYIEEAECLCDEVIILDSEFAVEITSSEELMDHDTDGVVVQLHDLPTAVPDFTADDDRVEAVELDDTHLVVTAQQGGLVTPDVVQALNRQGHELVDPETSHTSLEEMFVGMTEQGEDRATTEVGQ